MSLTHSISKTTKDALDGNHRLEENKQNANHDIDNLPNLTNAQKTAEKALINNKQTLTSTVST